jgi:hypothetical protein
MFRTSTLVAALFLPSTLRAQTFEHYTNEILAKVPGSASANRVNDISPAQLVEHAGAVPGTTATLLVVRTNEGRYSKLLVQPARQKIAGNKSVPILLIERFVTYKEGDERTIVAEGQNVRLFDDFQFNLDIGQIVPASVGGDLRFTAKDERIVTAPVGKAEIYVLTKPHPEATPKKSPKLVIGTAFEARYFNGVYQIYDDGRRSGELHLKVADNNDVTGFYYSDKDGQKYEVIGKVGNPQHAIQFKVAFPKTVQQFQGMLFTGDGRALTGFSQLQGRETGFYAVRIEDK